MGLNDVLAIIENALRSLCGWLCELIYPLIADSYQLFIDIGSLLYSDKFSAVYDKISLIIGIFMVFRLTFWLIEMLVNPDSMSDKEKNPGKMIQKVLVAVVLLAITPRIFKLAYNLQYEIVTENVIEKIISVNNADEDESSIGQEIAASLFINFYTLNETPIGSDANKNCEKFTSKEGTIYSNLKNDGELELTNYCLTARFNDDKKDKETNDYSEYVINFNGIFAVIVGAIVLWMMIMYCISAGARYAQLIFLQIIAPVPIMCYLAPGKDNMFSKWVKQCTTTYLDLFIRIAIISFVLLLSNMLLTNENNILQNIGVGNSWLVNVFLVLGLLTFAKKAPELIQELLPKSVTKASGDFGLSWKKRTDGMLFGKAVSTTARAISYGAVGAAAVGATGLLGGRGAGRISGLIGGMGRGLVAGSKSGSVYKNLQGGIKQQQDVNKKKIDWANNGSTIWGRTQQRMANTFGYQAPAEQFDNQIAEKTGKISSYKETIAPIKRRINAYNEVSSSKKAIEDRAVKSLLEKTPPKNAKLQEYFYNVQNAKANLEAARASGVAVDIAKAQVEYNQVLDKNKKDYITFVMENRNNINVKNDEVMKAMFNQLESIVNNDNNGAFTDGEILNKKSDMLKNYEGLDKFEGETTKETQELTYNKSIEDNEGNMHSGGIANLEREIKVLEDEKIELESSKERKAADADRNAVGGHHGGKK